MGLLHFNTAIETVQLLQDEGPPCNRSSCNYSVLCGTVTVESCVYVITGRIPLSESKELCWVCRKLIWCINCRISWDDETRQIKSWSESSLVRCII